MHLSLYAFIAFGLGSQLTTAASSVPNCKCSPSDACWPTAGEWAAFNKTLSGRLLKTVPPASVCYKSEDNFNATECQAIVDAWTTSPFHSSNPYSILDPSWSGAACQPLYQNGTSISGDLNATSKGCSLGNLSPYVVNATTAAHVQTAIRFARKNNLRLNVKNTGHNPEKSSAYGSLGIWTHNMKGFQFHKSFKACDICEPHMAGTVGAGIQDGELFAAMAKHGAIAVGGTNSDVGVVGWSAGGGHGYATGQYGMGADSILEAELVTPEGKLIRVNERDYSDLFWAIRGGGGSTFGVIISVTVKAHPMPSVGIVNIDVSPRNHTSPKQWWNTVAKVHREMADLQDAGYAGYYTITGPPISFHNTVFVYNVSNAAEARKVIRPLESALKSANSSVITEISQVWTETWYELIEKLGPLADASGVGTKRSVRASRLVTRRAIEDTDLFARTLEEIGPRFVAPENGVSNPSLSGTMTIGKTPMDNALNPVWRETVVHLISEQEWNDTLPDEVAEEVINEMTYGKGYALRQLAPDSGSYINEANSYEPDWQWSFWGPNYPRLEAIKQKYDPDNILWCRTCVGSAQLIQHQNGSLCRAL
ncbi:hypothetical protein MYU51_001695 [Penicillium brevicompactum]|uniref:uncharacterized protein n=1 Tax=Penicillium brevicompactum TaxID=5074 RepID=UPI0025406925|nr:uncharacterized protein N7506_009881 [Penicillium brevicompactum]KAJ5326779.1 hypothetical protein N7506_009881 [Penicillium brevicompactum]